MVQINRTVKYIRVNLDYFGMKFNKKLRVGVSILCLLLIFTTYISLIDLDQKTSIIDENLLSISPADDLYETLDGYANNNERYNATYIGFMNGTKLSFYMGDGLQWDKDFYMIDIPVGYGHLKVNVSFLHSLGDINVRIWDGYTIVDNAFSSTDDEIIDYFAPSSGYYYIEVLGSNTGNNYDLIYSTHRADDQYEENDYAFSAYDISTFRNSWIFGVQHDDDWYNFTVIPGDERLKIDLLFYHYEGDIDITLFDNTITGVAWSSSVDDNEYINYVLPVITIPTTYYILIHYGNQGNNYDLLFDMVSLDDQYEENDNWGAAVDISRNESIYHYGIQADDDWYKTFVDWNETGLYVEVYHDDFLGHMEFEIYYYDGINPYNNWIAWTDYTWIDMNVPWGGWYYIHIYGNDTGNQYRLYWEDDVPYEDNYEPNNFKGEAYDLNYYERWGLPFGPGIQFDDDWYVVTLGEHIYIDITFSNLLGNIDMEIWYEDTPGLFILLAGSYSTDDYEFIDMDLPKYGDYYILVAGSNFGNEYELWWERGGGFDDYFEDNDFFWNATYIHPNYYPGLRIVDYDEDWFSLYLNSSDSIEVYIYFDHWEGNLELELYDPNNSFRIASRSGNNDEQIFYTADISGEWLIRVYHANSNSRVRYDLDIWVNSGGDDHYENNDHLNEAYGLWDDERTWISDIAGLAVQGNDDWYMIYVTPHFEQVVVELEFNYSQGEIYLDLFNNDEVIVGVGSNTTTDRNLLSLNVTVGDWGKYFIKITGVNAKNEYNLWWDDIRTDFSEDDYEENDNFINATDLTHREDKELRNYLGFGVQYDQDWFEIFVGPDQTLPFILIVEMFYDSAEGLLGFEVYDDSLKKITGNFTLEDNDFVAYRLRSNGTFYIKVFGDNTGNVYNLLWKTKDDIPIEEIPGYDILILLGSIFGVASIVIIKWKRSKFNRK